MLLQEREGWLSEPSLRALAARLRVPLHRLESVSTFYSHFRRRPPPALEIAVCRDLPCMLAGGKAAFAALRERFAGRSDVEVREVSCVGRCDAAPAALANGEARHLPDLDAPLPAAAPRFESAELYASPEERFGTLRAAAGRDSAAIIAALKEAGLCGMGGAGFSTGAKWDLVARQKARPKYVICNADESEPGTFKDREILAALPHLVIEGMALGALAVGAERGFVFIRHEYGPERRALERALGEARRAGALGPEALGPGRPFEIEVFVSPGGYILGEETALLECMEDRRGEPRNKPPYPGEKGLFGQPTLINNVETFAHAVGIVRNGAAWWRALGRPGFAGRKFVAVSGDVERPGVYLVAMGTPMGEVLALAGGVRGGARLLAFAPGGASSNFLPPEKLSVPLDFQALAAAGSMLGSGAAIFLAEGRDLREVGLNVLRFFRNESCGKCVPCRLGTEKAVAAVEAGEDAVAFFEDLHATLALTSICGLGQVALSPLISIRKGFPPR
jgi:NADH:ubiquinone oxidoreductase subunit F (NADH-binding)